AAAVLVVPAAEADTRTAAVGTATTQSVAVRLRNTRAALAQASAEVASIRNELSSSHLRVQTVRAQASKLTTMLRHTAARLRAAQAQLAAIPTPLAVAEEQVRHEVAYVQGGVAYPRGQLVSQAATDYVVGHVSVTKFGYLEVVGGKLPTVNADSALRAQAGICGYAATTFAQIVSRFGLPVRSVQFFYEDAGPPPTPDVHVGVEVFYGGGWHYYDPTYGQFWTNANGEVLSIADVRAGMGTLQKDLASFTNVFENAVLGDDTWFETYPGTRVVIGAADLSGKRS
ncbi:MAG TPA: transglutaminase domain-containing protein, partial [Solirubrobacteraceae bacterium]|nr:transglutaminase domain-containing protein [Solirubrobacteraceae bacterium]